MKINLTIVVLLCAISSVAQVKGDTLFTPTGKMYIKGSFVNIGEGSKSDKGYAYIMVAPSKVGKKVVMPVPLTPGWAGYRMKIVGFEIIGNDTMGEKTYLILTTDENVKGLKYLCDPELAKKAGELL